MKRNFSPTKEFVDQYLNDVVNHPLPFGDEEKNELTLEASHIEALFYSNVFPVENFRLFKFTM